MECVQVLETLMAWCDAQLAGYTSAVQNDLEEMHEQTTPWIRVQVCSLILHASLATPSSCMLLWPHVVSDQIQ